MLSQQLRDRQRGVLQPGRLRSAVIRQQLARMELASDIQLQQVREREKVR